MATAFIIKHRYDALRVILSGSKLITGVGENAVVQSFASTRAAREHLDLVLSRRRREGYAIEEQELEDADEEILAHADVQPDPLAGCVSWDAEQRRLKIVFKGATVPAGRCEAIVERALQLQPVSLQVLCDHASPGAALSAALARTPLPSVHHFIFDTFFQTVTRQRNNSPGDLGELFAALPNLERAFFTGALMLQPVTVPQLRELYLLGDPLSPATLAALGACQFPALETLGMTLCSDGGPAEELEAALALRRMAAPNLRSIDVHGVSDLLGFLDALTQSPLPPTWSSLRMDGRVDDEDALLALLTERAGAMASLSHLGLPLGDELSLDGEAHAKACVEGLADREELRDLLTPGAYDTW
jgi:hypothetical protein